ncbi:cellulose binding domain-containing protein [Streptomyces sp. NPDC102473]|uniref:cellulose binding domain-containing protein n=1 Tax=Streptomyces sp. NPDC102473 TaxID=3366180 RepID=UPI00381E9429
MRVRGHPGAERDHHPPSGTVRAVDAGFDRRIAAGATQSFGFQGTWSGAYAEAARFARDGAACTVA